MVRTVVKATINKNAVIAAVIIFSLCILCSSMAFSSEKASELIVGTAFLNDKIGKPGWVIMDVRFTDEYAEGHIPGAVLLPEWISKLYVDDTKRFPTVIPRLEKAIGEMGIGNESHVIVYGYPHKKSWDAVMFWILEAMGCNSALSECTVHFYDGGIERWQAEGGNPERAESKVEATTFKAAPGARRGANVDEVKQAVDGKEKTVIVDARTTAEYEGTDVRALRGGHIPKAVNIDYSKNFDPQSYRMRPLSELKSMYRDIPYNSRVITYCQSGHRASYAYLVLRALGYNDVAIFHDGWRAYGSNLNLPAENETWFDFTTVNKTVKAVQELEAKMK
jgi:thiosulfate/3-mercaptopyruvate sulfurtransferase